MGYIDDVIRETEKAARELAARSPAGEPADAAAERQRALDERERMQRLAAEQRRAAMEARAAAEAKAAALAEEEERRRRQAEQRAAAARAAAQMPPPGSVDPRAPAPPPPPVFVHAIPAAERTLARGVDPARIRQRMREPMSLRELFIAKEIFDRPRSLRRTR